MSESSKAVFLSYASQDSEAAKRIADALRGAGVEVWFDAEGGLEHGDEWDAKIRRQIKECVLFIPVISANTQAREEGYFRIEWELAAQRALGIASGVAFILPVLIDGTKEPDALVPDRFRSVQWTKLPGGNVPADVLQRFLKLWSHRAGALKGVEAGRPRPAEERGGPAVAGPPPDNFKPGPKAYAFLAAVVAMIVAALGWWFLRGSAPATAAPAANSPASIANAPVSPPAPLSEARQLVAKARAMFDSLDASRDDYKLAEELLAQARAKEATDAEVWAAESQLHGFYLTRGWDTSNARRESARAASQRALRLDAQSFEARLAQALLLNYTGREGEEKERLLRILRREHPADHRVLRALSSTLERQERLEEAVAVADEAAALPGGDPLALYNKSLGFWFAGRTAEAEAAIQATLAQKPFTGALLIAAWYRTVLHGDTEGARALLDRIAPDLMMDDRAAFFGYVVERIARRPDAALARLVAVPRDWINDFWYRGPKGLLVGDAQAMAGRTEAATGQWAAALKLVEEHLVASPNDANLAFCRVLLLAHLGRIDEANRQFTVLVQMAGIDPAGEKPVPLWVAECCALLGRKEDAIRQISLGLKQRRRAVDYTAALLRLDPRWDPLRDHPGFAALIAEAEAIESATARKPATASTVDDKSVAVLAFANLSDDKANEYFSDGISEELLNVLAKVPKLKVAARTSSFYFKGRDEPIPEIAQKLGVAYVVEGSVRKAGNKVRITAQLIKAADGFHVWSETYDRDLTDIFAVQDEIARNILGVVKGSLLGDAELASATATKPEAYSLFLQAQAQLALRGEFAMIEAERLFKATLAVDPDYVPALVGLARTQFLLPSYTSISGPKARALAAEAKQAAEHALRLEPGNAAALTVHGSILSMSEWRWADGEAELLRARELAPNDPWVANLTGDFFIFTGNVPAALAAKRKWTELDPLSATSHWDLGFASLLAKKYDQAIQCGERARQLSPTSINPPSVIALAAGRAGRLDLMNQALVVARRDVHENEGLHMLLEADCAILEKRPDEAHRFLAQVEVLAAKGEASPAYIGYLHLLLGESDLARTWLQRGYDLHDAALTWAMNLDFAPIAADPKTRSILDLPGLKELYEIRQRNARVAGRQP